MSKGYRAVYDGKGMAYEYVNGKCTFIREDLTRHATPNGSAPMIQGDLPEFVSPIDGSVISGRAGLREHCLRHNVIPTEDLKGLPMRTMNTEHRSSEQYREETRRTMAEIINSRTY